jgi:hypothetical protein
MGTPERVWGKCRVTWGKNERKAKSVSPTPDCLAWLVPYDFRGHLPRDHAINLLGHVNRHLARPAHQQLATTPSPRSDFGETAASHPNPDPHAQLLETKSVMTRYSVV